MNGLVTKGIGGFYYVSLEDGQVVRAKGRGLLKRDGASLLVGDRVMVEIREDGDSWITELLPRKNQFIRPPISNIDVFAIVMAPTQPKVNFQLLDKFLIMAERAKANVIICFNKADLADDGFVNEVEKAYSQSYKILWLEATSGKGVHELMHSIEKNQSLALAGPSGVGKSTIINALIPEATMETGDVSQKTRRGKHTTRHVEIFPLGEGFIFDTPGFTSFEILDVDKWELGSYYEEFGHYGQCKFKDCLHRNEPECKVIEAVNKGLISKVRYQSYLANLDECEKERKKFK